MDLRETGQITPEQEYRHWWIRTRFFFLEQALRRLNQSPSTSLGLRILEMGCGTGCNLRFMRTESSMHQQIASLLGVDSALPENPSRPTGLQAADQLSRQLPRVQTASSSFDALVAMDVIEHVPNDVEILKNWLEQIRPGGIVFITVPAFQSLWSYHDEFLGHFRRYTRKSLEHATQAAGLQTLHTAYAFGALFPVVFLIRKFLGSRKGKGASDLKPAPFFVNFALETLGRIEAWFGGNPFFGTSVVGLFVKPESGKSS